MEVLFFESMFKELVDSISVLKERVTALERENVVLRSKVKALVKDSANLRNTQFSPVCYIKSCTYLGDHRCLSCGHAFCGKHVKSSRIDINGPYEPSNQIIKCDGCWKAEREKEADTN